LIRLELEPLPERPRDLQETQDKRAAAVQWTSLLIVVVLLSAIALWVVSPRFELTTPSLVDDWSAISQAPDQVSDIVRLDSPEEQRFRPGWVLWNYVQWHTFDAPRGMVSANVWNAARIVVLVAGLCLLTALGLPAPRGPLEAVVHAGLAGTPALLVISAPRFAVDLARFGPQEPLLVGGMALGGSLLVLTVRALVRSGHPVRWWVPGLGVAGAMLWLFGTYQKETSLAVIPLLCAGVWVGRSRLATSNELSAGRQLGVGALAAVVALPLLHVLVESLRIMSRGDLVYDAEVDSGLGAARGFRELYEWADTALPPNWRLYAACALFLTAVAMVLRRQVHPLAIASLVSGVLVLGLAGQSGVVATRYYIPAFALFAVALAWSLSWLPPVVELVGLVGILIAFMPPTSARDEVRLWVESERAEAAFVATVGELHAGGCVVAAAGLQVEHAAALPVLMSFERDSEPVCDSTAVYLVAGYHDARIALVRACASGSLERLRETRTLASLYRCGQLRSEPVRDPDYGLVETSELVELRRVSPAS
jgi:hypothetical protein